MDLSKFKTSDWLKVGGALAMFIAYFLDWTSIDCGGFGGPGVANACDNANLSGSDFFFRGTLPWLLVLAVGVLTVLLVLEIVKSTKLPWGIVFIGASGLALLLVIIYIIHPSYSGVSGIGRGIGAWLALIATGVVLAGSVMGFTESGGNLNDLKDVNKLKSQFGIAGKDEGGSTPPPPPSGMAPPPPPPPPPPSA